MKDRMDARAITEAIDRLVSGLAPACAKRKMYGGIVFEAEPGDPKSRFGGYFVYAKHVGVEFSNGVLLHDPDGILEGKGKARRHVKLKTVEEIDTKRLADFVTQAVKLQAGLDTGQD